jgi:hypothetical protein
MKRKATTEEAKRVAPSDGERATRAVVKVGAGRGFVMELAEPNPDTEGLTIKDKRDAPPPFIRRRIIVTAAHCLPHQPPAFANASMYERTYLNVIGPRGDSPSITAECLFVDAVADLAVLGEPDGQAFGPDGQPLYEASDAYRQFTYESAVLTLSDGPDRGASVTGWLLSLDGHWNRCMVAVPSGWGPYDLWITAAAEGIFGGMSGSPILLDDGRVIGVVCTSTGTGSPDQVHTEAGPQPNLARALPVWLVNALKNN